MSAGLCQGTVKHRAKTKRNGVVEFVRLLQLSAAGEVFLEGTCPLSRCPQTAKFPAPVLLGARRRWVRKATAFRGRSEQDRSALFAACSTMILKTFRWNVFNGISLCRNRRTRLAVSLQKGLCRFYHGRKIPQKVWYTASTHPFRRPSPASEDTSGTASENAAAMPICCPVSRTVEKMTRSAGTAIAAASTPTETSTAPMSQPLLA